MKIFEETQRFNQWWLISLMSFMAIFILYSLIIELKEIENKDSRQIIALIFASTFSIIIVFLIFTIKLKTRIDELGIRYQFFPIHIKPRIIAWKEMNHCYVRKYRPIIEYGGWGIRGLIRNKFLGLARNGKAYNVKGNVGIQLELKDGGKILFGTQQPERVRLVLKTYSTMFKFNSDNNKD